jgi:hypothetical protein
LKLKAILILAAVLAIAGTTYYFVSRPKPAAPPTPHYYVWEFDMQHLQNITMSLPKSGQPPQSFDKNSDDSEFYFAPKEPGGPSGPMVDNQRWGGGIPLLLSGPGANRLILQNATDAQVADYGFNTPNLTATLTLDDGKTYEVQVGDLNPEGTNYYTRLASNNDIYTVDKSWYDVISRIVTDPPYIPATFTIERPTVSAAEVAAGTPVDISIKVTNTGSLSGSYDLTMKINGDVIDTKTVTLDGNLVSSDPSKVVTFTVTEAVAGKYIVSINTRNVTFTVK